MSTSSFSEQNFDPDSPTTCEECMGLAQSYENLALFLGFSQARAYEIGNNRYDACVNQVDKYHAAIQG
ncbi:hypothetical protein [Psychroserpens sp. SPM9]|uniref:hypothetical protein n=1 Tax=Psychroserpens sp. SPM9 TaxID=2975598 RepID=UPI0021A67366|nr:hypothetical protein [Psychroserpens sp. SPM9]MDG5491169.1 hypothetical protein [Psychroserpens sp. SPM9]